MGTEDRREQKGIMALMQPPPPPLPKPYQGAPLWSHCNLARRKANELPNVPRGGQAGGQKIRAGRRMLPMLGPVAR